MSRPGLPAPLRQALYYGLGLVMMKGVSLLMLPLFTAWLSVADYGRLEVLLTVANLGTLLLGLGLADTLFRYAGLAEDEAARRRVAAEVAGFALAISLAALATLPLAAPWLAGRLPVAVETAELRLLLFAVALEGCVTIPLAWLRMGDRAGLFFLLTSGKVVLQAGLTVALLRAGWGLAGGLLAGAVAAAALALALVTLHGRDAGFALPRGGAGRLLGYGVPIVGGGLAGFALTGLDRWLLAAQLGEAALAPYAVAAKFALATTLLLQPFALWWYPRRFRLLREHEGEEGRRLNARYAILGAALGFLAAGLVGVAAPPLIRLLTPAEYHAAAAYVPWLVLAMALKNASELLNLGCYSGRESRLQMKIQWGASLVGLLLYGLLIPPFGVHGALFGLLGAYAVQAIAFYTLSQRRLPLPYRFRPLLASSGLSALLMAAGQLV